uniref:BTB domain-containing protein n=1 Tax=Panagrolaimus sp. PS1159 TaxID=55785 RepID=A0AC35FFI1_9BILA
MPICKAQISLTKPTTINSDGITFDIVPSNTSAIIHRTFTIKNHQKNCKIVEVSCEHGCDLDFRDDKLCLTFQCTLLHWIFFHISPVIHAYDLVVKSPRKELFDENNAYQCEIGIPNFEDIKFNVEYKRLQDGTMGVWLTNRWDVKINGSTGNQFFNLYDEEHFAKVVHFEFDPDVVREQIVSAFNNTTITNQTLTQSRINETVPKENSILSSSFLSAQTTTTSDSLPSIESPSNNDGFNPELVQLNPKYSDVHFYTSDGHIYGSYQCILSTMSPVFDQMFQNSPNIPVQIAINGIDSKAIQHGLDFCHGKIDKISGYETDLLKFSSEFMITKLQVECIPFLERKISVENVCQILTIAKYNRMFSIRDACIKFIAKNNHTINLSTLPPGILDEISSSIN